MSLQGDTPYVLYHKTTGDSLKVSRFNGTAWEQVGPAVGRSYSTPSSDIAMANDTAYVAFRAYSPTYDGTVMKFDGANWVQVGSSLSDNASQIDIHAHGANVYVAFQDLAAGSALKIMMLISGTWIAMPGIPAVAVHNVKMTSDALGNLYVAYESSSDVISVVTNDGSLGGAWSYVGSQDFSRNIGASGILYSIKAESASSIYVLARETDGVNTGYKPSVYQYKGAGWAYTGYPSFWSSEETGGSVTATTVDMMDMTLKSGNPWVIFREETVSGNPASIVKFTP